MNVGVIARLALAHWKESLIVLLITAATVFYVQWRGSLIDRGIAQERSRQADSSLAVDTPQRIKAETALVHDIKTVTRLIVRHDTVEKWRSDTVYVQGDPTPRIAVPASEVAKADSAKTACLELANSCAAFRVSATKEIADWKAKAQAAPTIVTRSCVESNVIVGAIGAAAGYFAHRR